MAKSFKNKPGKMKFHSKVNSGSSRVSRKIEIQKHWDMEIEEKIADSLNGMKYGFIFLLGKPWQ